ncbi:MAG: host-nuclease inhibitor Gam family protein [Patescibacteria group bacterium]|nr:host-nuclease inhibitor Gam family protein [Patescibacteria group bacterium]
MAKKQRPKRVPPPKSMFEAAQLDRRLGTLLSRSEQCRLDAALAIKQFETAAEKKIKEYTAEVREIAKAIRAFAEEHREEILEPGRKSATLQSGGIVAWSTSPPAVELAEKAETIVKRLKTLKLERFIRVKEEVNKEALLADQDVAKSIEGVNITQTEKFTIRPSGRDERLNCNLSTNRWTIVVKEAESLSEAAE